MEYIIRMNVVPTNCLINTGIEQLKSLRQCSLGVDNIFKLSYVRVLFLYDLSPCSLNI